MQRTFDGRFEHLTVPAEAFTAAPIAHAEPTYGAIRPENFCSQTIYDDACADYYHAASLGAQAHFADPQGRQLPQADCYQHAFGLQHAGYVSTLDPVSGASAGERTVNAPGSSGQFQPLNRANMMTADRFQGASIPRRAQAVVFLAHSGRWHYARIERDAQQRVLLARTGRPALTHVDGCWHREDGMGGTLRVASLTAEGWVPEAQRGVGVPEQTDPAAFAAYCLGTYGGGVFGFVRREPPLGKPPWLL